MINLLNIYFNCMKKAFFKIMIKFDKSILYNYNNL